MGIVTTTNFSLSDSAKQVKLSLWRPSSLSVKCTLNTAQSLLHTVRSNLRNNASMKVSCRSNNDINVLEARCMDEVYDSLAERLLPIGAATATPILKFIDVDLNTSMDRVLKRHMSKSNRSRDEAKWRIDYNDHPNAELSKFATDTLRDTFLEQVNAVLPRVIFHLHDEDHSIRQACKILELPFSILLH